MRKIDDFQNAFGTSDDSFQRNVFRTLAALQESEKVRPMKHTRKRLSIAVVCACFLIVATTALAATNTWGILDFLKGRRSNVHVSPDIDIVQRDIPQETNDTLELASFKVREGVFDGQSAYIVVEIRPNNPDYLLLGVDTLLSDPLENLGPLYANKSGTVADYARANNKTPLHTWVGITQLPLYSADFVLEEDGTLVYMINGRPEAANNSEWDLRCGVAPFLEDDIDMKNEQTMELSFTLQNMDDYPSITNVESADYEDCGVRIDKITMTGTPMAIYTEIEFSVIDQEKFLKTENGLWFEFLDENDNRLPNGAAGAAHIEQIDENHYIQKDSISAAQDLPDKVIVRGYNGMDKTRYETHNLKMK